MGDSCNSFSKKTWHIVKNYIYSAVLNFFEFGKMHKMLNCTNIKLIPEVPSVDHVHFYIMLLSLDLFHVVMCFTSSYQISLRYLVVGLLAGFLG